MARHKKAKHGGMTHDEAIAWTHCNWASENMDWDKLEEAHRFLKTEWLDIIWKGEMAQINGKGKIQNVKRQKKNTR